ncbi:MAG: hypothetical protein WDZ59_11315 [Pirellulales bacterium]
MSEPYEIPGQLNELERQLAALSPRASRLNRDQLMYLAGRAAAENDLGTGGVAAWVWPSATGVMTAVSVLLAMMLVLGNRSGVAMRDMPERGAQTVRDSSAASQDNAIAKVNSPRQSPIESTAEPPAPPVADDLPDSTLARGGYLAFPSVRASEAGYIHLRNVALRMGTEAMGQTHRASGGPQPTYWELTSALGEEPVEVQPQTEPAEGDPQSGVESLPAGEAHT